MTASCWETRRSTRHLYKTTLQKHIML